MGGVARRSVNDYHLVAGRRRWTPWEAVMEIQEPSPSMLRNVDSGPSGRWCRRFESVHH
jgi:hypothetical protein